jgi:glycolate oxidase
MMDRKATNAVEPFVKAGYDLTAEAILLAESDGTPDEVADEIAQLEQVVKAAGSTQCVYPIGSRTPAFGPAARMRSRPPAASRRLLLHGRHDPAQHLAACSERSRTWKKASLRCMNVFHAGDGNLHPLILFDANQAGE